MLLDVTDSEEGAERKDPNSEALLMLLLAVREPPPSTLQTYVYYVYGPVQ